MPPFDAWRSGIVAFDVVAAGWGPRSGVLARQRHRLAALLEGAAVRSGPYRERLDRRNGRAPPLEAIAPVTKPELMARFDEWVTDPGIRHDELLRFVADPSRIGTGVGPACAVWTSSGSSGEPGVFVQDAATMAVYDALEAWRRPGWTAGGGLLPRMAFVGATTGHFASTVSVERLRRLAPGLASALRGFSFLQPPDELAGALERFAPAVLATYPTEALLLASLARAERLAIAPAEIWTGGETLTPAARRRIEQDFRCPVRNSYGASEFLALAAECRFGQLHLNDDWVILEPVDEQHRPVPEGEAGHTTLLTNLANHLQPLIRYDLGDCVSLHGAGCPCGSPLTVLQVQGRSDDLIFLRDERRRAVPLPPLALATVLEEEGGVFDFQLEQTDARSLEMRIGRDGPDGRAALASAETALRRYLAQQGLAGVRLNAVCGADLERSGSGKQRRIVGLSRHRRNRGIPPPVGPCAP